METTPLAEEVGRSLEDLAKLRDEIRLRAHLLGMDAKDAWKEIEDRIAEIEGRVEREGRELGRATSGLVSEVTDAVRRFKDRIEARRP